MQNMIAYYSNFDVDIAVFTSFDVDGDIHTFYIDLRLHVVGIIGLLLHWTTLFHLFVVNFLGSNVFANLEPENVAGQHHKGKLKWEDDHVNQS